MQDKILCDHAIECKQKCRHALPHETYGRSCEEAFYCGYIGPAERTLCKPLAKKEGK